MSRKNERRSFARWIALGVVGLVAMSTAVVVGATGASAHHAGVEIEAACGDAGTIHVTLEVYNSQGSSQPMTLKSVVSTGFLTPAGATSGSVLAGGSGGKWTTFEFDIPASSTGTISYAFNVQWANGTTANGYKASTQLPTDCEPPPPSTGGFSVTKAVTGATAGHVPNSVFTVDYDCTGDISGTLSLKNGETKSVEDLPEGTSCTLDEGTPPATSGPSYVYGTPTFDPAGPIVIGKDQTVAVQLANPITQDKGGFSVTKTVTGETAGYVGASTFSVDYTCSGGVNGSLTLVNGETKSVSDLAVGTTCTLSEGAKPATSGPSYSYGAESFAPSSSVTIVKNQTASVTLSNPITRVTGGFAVTKTVTGETDGYVPGSTFKVDYACSGGVNGSLTLVDGQTKSVSNLPIGTTCNLTEGTKPATSGPGYAYGTEVFAPSSALTITGTTSIGVTLTNPINAVFGGFSVTKKISGESAGHVAGSSFSVTYSCTDGSNATLDLVADETKSATGIQAGSTCTLSEGAKPATSGPSYAYWTETFSPSGPIVVAANQNTAVTLTNPIIRLLGAVSISKSISGATEGYVADSTFDFTLDCAGTAFDKTVTLAAGASTTVGDIPLGTSCSVTEIGLPTPVAGYEYGTPTVTPSNGTVVVNSTSTPVTVAFDNPIIWLSDPAASIEGDCETDSALVTLANEGGGQVVFAIFVDGVQYGPTHVVGSTPQQVVIPLVEDVPATIRVEAGDQEIVAEEVVTNDCQDPIVESFVTECAEGGVAVTVSNSGVKPVDLTVSKDGDEVTTVTVGDEPVEVLVPFDEDETALIEVFDGPTLVGSSEVTYDCQEPPTTTTTEPPTTTTTPPSTTTTPDVPVSVLGKVQTPAKGALPVTGSNAIGIVAIAVAMLLAGAALIGLARRRS